MKKTLSQTQFLNLIHFVGMCGDEPYSLEKHLDSVLNVLQTVFLLKKHSLES